MTREEAIKELQSYAEHSWGDLNDVFKMAISALRQQEPNDWICTLKCTALMDEGMCSHGGLCCLYESQRTIKENQPLTLDELRKMDGDPVWVQFLNHAVGYWDISKCHNSEFFNFCRSGFMLIADYGKTWLAYRQKPEEGKV